MQGFPNCAGARPDPTANGKWPPRLVTGAKTHETCQDRSVSAVTDIHYQAHVEDRGTLKCSSKTDARPGVHARTDAVLIHILLLLNQSTRRLSRCLFDRKRLWRRVIVEADAALAAYAARF